MTMSKEELMQLAKEAMTNSYSPYSNFPVGAALLCKDGTVIKGANIENVSFGVTNCAERSALFAAASQGYRMGDFEAIAICGKTEDFLPPCNVCRQALVEFCSPDLPVHLLNGKDEIMTITLGELAPYSFTSLHM